MNEGRTNFYRECGHPWIQETNDRCVACLREEIDRLRTALRGAKLDMWAPRIRSSDDLQGARDRIDQALKEGLHTQVEVGNF